MSLRTAIAIGLRRHWATGTIAVLLIVALLAGIGSSWSRTGAAVQRANEVAQAQPATPSTGAGVRVIGDAVKDPTVTAREKAEESGQAWVIVALVAFALGAALTAGETSSRTLGRALLEEPKRRRLITSRMVLTGLLSLGGAAVIAAVSLAVWRARFSGVPDALLPSSVDQLLHAAQGCVAVLLLGLLGAATGLLGRSPGTVVAIGVFVMLLGEQALGADAAGLAKWLPGHLLEAASGNGIALWRDLGLDPAAALAGLLAWVVAATALGTWALSRRDVA